MEDDEQVGRGMHAGVHGCVGRCKRMGVGGHRLDVTTRFVVAVGMVWVFLLTATAAYTQCVLLMLL